MAQRKAAGAASRRGAAGSSAKRPSTPTTSRRGRTSIVNQRRTPWGMIITVAALVAFAVAVVLAVVLTRRSHSPSVAATGQIVPSSPTGTTTTQAPVTQVANSTGVRGVLAWNTQGWPGNGASHSGALQHDHVPGPVKYSVLPPVGGPHNPTWMNAGVYSKPIPAERAVHNLEHGAIWITYDPSLPADQVATLRAFVAKQTLIPESQATGVAGQANRYLDLSPWPSDTLPSRIVMSAWGYQLRLTSASDPRMQDFVNTFRRNARYTPEYGAAVDGVPVATGGRPLADGGAKPNPS